MQRAQRFSRALARQDARAVPVGQDARAGSGRTDVPPRPRGERGSMLTALPAGGHGAGALQQGGCAKNDVPGAPTGAGPAGTYGGATGAQAGAGQHAGAGGTVGRQQLSFRQRSQPAVAKTESAATTVTSRFR